MPRNEIAGYMVEQAAASRSITGDAAGDSADPPVIADSADTADDDLFERRYLAHAPQQLPNRTKEDLHSLAREHRRRGAIRLPGEVQVYLRDLDADTTAIEIVNDDAPYLVD